MKNRFMAMGILVLALVFGMTVVGCDNNPEDNTQSALGEEATLSGQVYTVEYPTDSNNLSYKYTPYSGDDLTVTAYGLTGVTGSISGGKLSFKLVKPADSALGDINDMFEYWFEDYTDLKIPSGVKGYSLSLRAGTNGSLSKVNYNITGNETSASGTLEQLEYIYVDKDATISGKGKTSTGTNDDFTFTSTTKDFSLALKAGWNKVLYKMSGTETATTSNITITISLGDSKDLKWVYYSNYH